ncbi:MAG TPA: hypothetical protein VL172_09220 [Kofleriaceae bacterium]|jgi:predicted CxxxxCH...CXXCH cytochrome family protein|nr:hypothetical protein [Kofleriaceae bacterium]
MKYAPLTLLLLAACDLGHYGTSSGRHHPEGYAAAEVHGLDLKMQAEDCRSCHGDDLTGAGAAASCDGCHTPSEPQAWRTDCTFCHGGGQDDTGAPPRNLDGTTEAQAGTFPPHAAHVEGGLAAPLDCVQCHVKATDALTQGHIFDATAGVAEVDLGGGLSGLGAWDRSSGCASTYCHGNGRGDNGTVAADAGPMTCASCHAGMDSGAAGWLEMSGLHSLHLGVAGVTCAECHQQVTGDGTDIVAADLHVDGQREIDFAAAGFSRDAVTGGCTGTCHDHGHSASAWDGGGSGGGVHPDGFAAASMHGPEFELGRQDCRGSCHGDQLQGASGPSCDSCHQAGWRTDCTYCHGGGANQTGAPPRDLASTNLSQSLSFRAHTRHVTAGMASAFDCGQCHSKPTDVLSPGHVLDATPGAAEVRFAGLNAGGAYNGAGTCSASYCHGNGRGSTGTITDGAPARTCASCHPGQQSSTLWSTMSGDHGKHLRMSGVTCATCHVTVTADAATIANRALHVDGGRTVAFNFSGMTYTVSTKACTGPCHGENHSGDRW